MHIPDGLVAGSVNAGAAAISIATCGLALARARRTLGDRQVPLLGVTAAFVFAAQMLNFPVLGGTSGHFLGAALASILLGPLNACLIMAVVLIIQCLGFADGGLSALGTNIFNMGVVGGIGSYGVFRGLRAVLPRGRASFLASAAVASWFSVVLASLCCAAELAVSGRSPWEVVVPAMGLVHAVIGIGEALITAAVLSTVLSARPDLIMAWNATRAEAQGT
jgi:cobalt/nickel transport system permease protein